MRFLFGFSGILRGFGEPLGVLFGLLGSLLGASWGDLGAKLSGLGVTFGALRFFVIFWNDFGSKSGAQRETFWEPKRSKNQ